MQALILFSGGLDSTVLLAHAFNQGKKCTTLSFDYGQRHKVELEAAKRIAAYYNVPHHTIVIDPSAFGNSSLVNGSIDVPKDRTVSDIATQGIPNTEVPARNTIFLAFAAGLAELQGAQEIYIGWNALDQIPYPDCRKNYRDAFQGVLNLATKRAVSGNAPQLLAPFIEWDKKVIISYGQALEAPLALTHTCYDPPNAKVSHCGRCDACHLRQKGFQEARVPDPTHYEE